MIRKLRSLVPPFLQKIDHHLLVNSPVIWATRIHYVLFATLVAGSLLWIKGWLVTPTSVPDIEFSLPLVCLISGMAWLFWGYSVYKFRPGKYDFHIGQSWQQALAYVVGTALFVMMPWSYMQGLEAGMERQLSLKTLEADYIALNYGERYWQYDDWEVESYVNHTADRYAYHSYFRSLRRLDHDNRHDSDPWNDYMTQLVGDSDEAKLAYASMVFHKYGGDLGDYSPMAMVESYKNGKALMDAKISFQKEVVQNHLHEIDSVYQLSYDLQYESTFMHILLFTSLLAGLAFLIFQYTSLKYFLWAIIAAVVLAILVGFLTFAADLMGIRHEEDIAIFSIWALWWLTVIGVFWGKKNQRIGLKKVGMILLAVSTVFAPLFTVFSLGVMWDFHFDHVMFSGDEFMRIFGYLSIIAAYLMWQLVYRHRLKVLQASPHRKSHG